ncbi:MAG: T9SS type A sorting domain-containing protein [Candidatus Cloacimonetes bacterium]|nr:T9SS type A sorting domain-containing protein [Candidatus Cloacimonadota bacterium]
MKLRITNYGFQILILSLLISQDTWIRTYQPFGNDVSYEVEDIRICPDSGYAVIGTVRYDDWDVDGFMMKTDSEGNLLWANIDSVDFIQDPHPSGFVVLEDGSFINAGNNYWSTDGHYLLKRNPQGGIEWTQQLDNEFTLHALELTNEENLITTGSSTYNTIFLEKLDLNGNLIWRKYYLPEGFTYGGGYSVTQTSDNGYALTGIVNGPDNWDVLVLKTDANGDSIWSFTFDGLGYHDIGHSIIESCAGNFIVIGEINGPIYRSIDTFILCINAFGDTLWLETIHNLSTGYSVVEIQDNNFVGYSWSGSNSEMTRLFKFDDDSEILWNEQLSFWSAEGDRCFHELPNEGFLCCGTEMYRTSIYIAKTDSMGQVASAEENEIIYPINNSIVCYPNPFRSSTTISFEAANLHKNLRVEIYNIKGQKVKTLINEDMERGIWKKIWNGKDNNDKPVSSGVYLYKLNVNGQTKSVKKCLLVK